MIGILLALQRVGGQGIAHLQQKYESVLGPLEDQLKSIPTDIQSQYVLQAELTLGSIPEMIPVYERTFHDLLLRYELLQLDEQIQTLELSKDLSESERLKKINELFKRKHTLIHSLSTGTFS